MRNVKNIDCDLCVIGGGMSGLCAAVTAARLGLKVVLVQDRNVLGGNASSEVRMWIRGAGLHFSEYREGGLIEELALENMYYNPDMNYSVWDGVLYNKVVSESNITPLLGATCVGATCDGNVIKSVSAWGLQSYNSYEIYAKYFADCSGDCILAEFINAKIMSGRESKDMFGEPMAQDECDGMTMGNTCMVQLRKGKQKPAPPLPFTSDLTERVQRRIDIKNNNWDRENFWWLEFGGDDDALHNAEKHNDTAVKAAFSAYSTIEKHAGDDFDMSLDWVGFLAGKRETRRYVGDYVLTANDVMDSTPFSDEIAYGGWSIDNHYPQGLYATEPNIHYYPKKPYAIPYRGIYSENIENLFFAGRNISVTHLALSSTRVMGTCAMLGQAVGVAAAVAHKHGVMCRGAGQCIDEIQQTLLNMDCFLLNTKRRGALSDNRERNFETDNRTELKFGETERYGFTKRHVDRIRIVFDSDFERSYIDDGMLKQFPMLCYNGGGLTAKLPPTLVKSFTVRYGDGDKMKEKSVDNNIHRLVFIDIDAEIDRVEFRAITSYGAKKAYLFSVDII